MREIKKVIIHCSDSGFGDAALIDKWHKERGWNGIGYHYVILNGCRKAMMTGFEPYKKEDDGWIETGRPIEEVGAHCEGQNSDSIGICLIGRHHFSAKQLYVSLPSLLKDLFYGYRILAGQIYGHYEFNPQKSCPNIDIALIKDYVRRLV